MLHKKVWKKLKKELYLVALAHPNALLDGVGVALKVKGRQSNDDLTSERPYPDFSSTSYGRTMWVKVRPNRAVPCRTKYGNNVRQQRTAKTHGNNVRQQPSITHGED